MSNLSSIGGTFLSRSDLSLCRIWTQKWYNITSFSVSKSSKEGKYLPNHSYRLSVVGCQFYALSFLSREVSIFFTLMVASVNSAYWPGLRYLRSWARRMRYSVSLAEPIAIWRKRAKSAELFLPQPSAMFVGIDAQARRIWLVSPYISSRGNQDVKSYILKVKSWDFFQTCNFLKSCMLTPFTHKSDNRQPTTENR